jgi:hypothetical protein
LVRTGPVPTVYETWIKLDFLKSGLMYNRTFVDYRNAELIKNSTSFQAFSHAMNISGNEKYFVNEACL